MRRTAGCRPVSGYPLERAERNCPPCPHVGQGHWHATAGTRHRWSQSDLRRPVSSLRSEGALDASDFLSRVDLLADIGFTVLISNYSEYYRLTSYFRRYTKEMIGVAIGINHLLEIFNEKYYENLEGGILESFGRLFRNAVKLYVYPMSCGAYDRYTVDSSRTVTAAQSAAPNVLITARNARIVDHLTSLYAHLLDNHFIDNIVGFDANILGIFSRDALRKIRDHDLSWENMVPRTVANAIKRRGLFGHSILPTSTEIDVRSSNNDVSAGSIHPI